ncbi:PAS domain S-box protein [uncultured Methanomethylovorans sp.]|uniref:PAS domain S-box protein n=1 Tax=uncultured Methanomethylovorans sp. TaxID=183759 RepID=UPI002AA8C0A4|nr:PAS domain S-box protein [uncultured Methanomethylovorans sp.]
MLQAVVFDSKGIIDQNLKNKLESLGIALSLIYQYDEKALPSLGVKKPDIIIYFCSGDNYNLFDKVLEISNNSGIPSIFVVSNSDENFFNKLNDAQSAWYIKEPFDENELYHVAKKALNNNAKEFISRGKEERYKNIFKKSTNGFALHEIVTDDNGKPVDYIFLEANKAFGILTGLDNESIIGKPVTEVIPGIEKDTSFIEIYGNVALNEQTVCFSEYVPQLDRYYDVCAYSTQKGQFATIFTDVTILKRSEEETRIKDEKCELALELVNMVPWEWDIESNRGHTLNDKNPHKIDMFEFSYEKCMNLVHPADRNYVEKIIENSIQKVEPCKAQYRMYDNEGKVHWFSTYGKPYSNANGKCVRMIGITQDITEYKETQESLEESEHKFRLLAENINDVIWTMSSGGKFLYVSPSVKKLTGFYPEEAMQRSLWETLTSESLRTVNAEMNMFFGKLQKGIMPEPTYAFEVEEFCKDGSKIWIEVRVNPIFDEFANFKFFLGVTRNINERKKTEDEIKKQKNVMDTIFHNAPIIMILINREGRIENINYSGMEATGKEKEELMGLLAGQVFSCVSSSKGQGCGKNIECRSCPVRNTFSETFKTGENFHKAEGSLNVLHNGIISTRHLLLSTAYLEIQGDAKVMLSVDDITEQKNAEQEILEAKMMAERANRIKSEFLATMSHELRTPLNAVIGYADLLFEETFGELNPKQRKSIGHISSSGKHLLDLINDILDLSKIESGKMELHYDDFFVNEALRNVEYIISPLAKKKNIRLEFSIESEVLTLHADKSRFKQILYNLASNAVKFTPEKGLVKIEVRKTDHAVEVAVTDSGIGIPEEQLKNLFIPFKQLDPTDSRTYEGTGLGLSLVKKFVELHGGKVNVKSEVGKGSTFSFWIPIRKTDQKTYE